MNSFPLKTIMVVALLTSLAYAADLRTNPSTPYSSQKSGGKKLLITPETLQKQILSLQRQVQLLQAQVVGLRSVLKVDQNGATLQAQTLNLVGESISVQAQGSKGLSLSSTNGITIDGVGKIAMKSKTVLDLQSQGNLSAKAGAVTNLMGSVIYLNGGGVPIATVGSKVAQGQVVSGSPTVLAQ